MMLAAVIETFPQEYFHVETVSDPKPGPYEVLVSINASGLCATDLHLLEGRYPNIGLPRIPGHELAGTIVEVGKRVSEWSGGDRVIAAIDVVCNKCGFCKEGRTNLCPNLTRIGFERDGSHAQFATVPEDNLIRIPDEIPFSEAAILPDAVACMYHCLVTQGKLEASQRVVILGAGGLGLHGVQIARLMGAEVLTTSRQLERRAMAKQLGAEAIHPNKQDIRKAANDFTSGNGLDVVIDCVGTKDTIDLSIDILKPGGRVVVVGYVAEEFRVRYIPLMIKEKIIVGCRGSTHQDLKKVVNLVAERKIQPIVDGTFTLERINEAASALREGKVVGRLVILPHATEDDCK